MKIIDEYNAELEILESYLHQRVSQGEILQILEAGCGREWYFRMEGIAYELTGVDMDRLALEARRQSKGDLTYCIVGDLRTATLEPNKYDVIYNAFVLEHVRGAEQVLENFVQWLRPGGILILRVPDRNGVQGFLARLTPHWAHVLYYRWAWRMKDAGKPGFAPYPTIYDKVVSISGLRQFCAKHGLIIKEELGVGSYRRGYGIIRKLTPTVARLIGWLTLGRIHGDYVDLTIIAEKT
ncbi:MAG: methyltransferase domain-containing protein, partial [Candidatus Acidiferrum sp.]